MRWKMSDDDDIIKKYAPYKEEIKETKIQLEGEGEYKLNNELIPRNEEGQIKLQFKTYSTTNTYKVALTVDEFVCKALTEEKYPFVTCELCEAKAFGSGCNDIKECKEYREQKEIQEKITKEHPEFNWKNINNNDKKIITEVELVRKGIIRLAKE